jgi:glycine/D-amino acid oxidase-like deaminating enzyme
MGNCRYLLGATYDRDWRNIGIDHERAVHGAHTLLGRWEAMTGESLAYQRTNVLSDPEVLSHRAGIRPASYDRHPLIGPHPHHPRMACLNGLGSKGSLMAPHLAGMLLDLWLEGRDFDPALVWHRRLDPTGTERHRK